MTMENLQTQEDFDGEIICYAVDSQDAGQRLDVFIGLRSQDSRSHIKNLIEKGKVFVNGSVKKAGYVLKVSDEITLMPEEIRQLDLTPHK